MNVLMDPSCFRKYLYELIYETKFSRIEQVKFVEDSL